MVTSHYIQFRSFYKAAFNNEEENIGVGMTRLANKESMGYLFVSYFLTGRRWFPKLWEYPSYISEATCRKTFHWHLGAFHHWHLDKFALSQVRLANAVTQLVIVKITVDNSEMIGFCLLGFCLLQWKCTCACWCIIVIVFPVQPICFTHSSRFDWLLLRWLCIQWHYELYRNAHKWLHP